ncbi:MAG TPA: ATP-binding protein [Polyangiaceae bacterium]|nr:ATP-binding protein [Polyangiaceae bacterium]
MPIRPEALARTRLIAGAAATFSLAVGAIGIVGWIFDIRLLKTGLTNEVSMKANTALGLCLLAAALLGLLSDRRSQRRARIAKGTGLGVALLGALTLSQHVFGWNLQIDELLFREAGGEAATASPGRMGPPACISFIFVGMGLLFFDRATRSGKAVAQRLALLVAPISFFAILGYATGAEQLYGIARYTGIAVHTAAALFLLAVGLFLARAEREPARLLVADNPGGEVVRKLLPTAILLPLVIGWLRTLGQKYQLYDTAFGRALLLLTLIALFTQLVWRVAQRLSTVAAERTAAELASTHARAEAERLALENVETLNLLDSLLAHAPIGLVFFDRDGRCVRLNAFLARMRPGPEATPAGQHVSDVLPGVSTSLDAVIASVFDAGFAVMDLEIASAPGSEREQSWLMGVFPVRDGRGAISLAGAVLIEISERKRLEAQRAALLDSERAARVEAERAATLKDEFLTTLSHELRTPLNAILGWTAIAKQVRDCPSELERPLETIERNARAQAQLIEDLLDISRIVSGQMRLAVEAVQLPGVVQAAVSAVAPAARAKEIRLAVEMDPDLIPITGDAGRLQQVVWNLLSNAVKFTPKGGQVALGVHRRGLGVELSVSDDGIGITPEFLPHVFDRFRQADSSTTRRHGGLGLGLAIVKQLVELHGGSVSAASPGEAKGSTFVIGLPLRSERHEGAAVESPAPLLLSDALAGIVVLVVDDESDAREFVGRALADRAASVVLVSEVDAALAVLERDEVHVLVSDIGMPGKDGYDLIRALRQRSDAKTIPAIALTAYARTEDRIRVLGAGFQLHVTKPVDAYELTLAVASLAGRTGA